MSDSHDVLLEGAAEHYSDAVSRLEHQSHSSESDSDSDIDIMELFDFEQFVLDGNDIRFQLPSHNPELTLGRDADDIQRRASTLKRTKTTRTLARRKSSKAPPIDRSLKPQTSVKSRRERLDEYDAVDATVPEAAVLVSALDHYQELQNLKSLSLPMGKKRDHREQLMSYRYADPTGMTLAKYTVTKHTIKKWGAVRKKISEATFYTDIIWSGTLKEIEGQFGAGIMEYFRLVIWMVLLNLLLFITTIPIIIPQVTMEPLVYQDKYFNPSAAATMAHLIQVTLPTSTSTTSSPVTTPRLVEASTLSPHTRLSELRHDDILSLRCTLEYKNVTSSHTKPPWYQHVIDFFQGTGFLEDTILFYGHYFNKTYNISENGRTDATIYPWYNTSVAYLIAIMFFFIVSLVFIVTSTSHGLESNLLADQVITNQCIHLVFSGWDYGLYKEKAVRIKKSLLKLELLRYLTEKQREELYNKQTYKEKILIVGVRIAVNLLVLAILAGCTAAVYFVQSEANNQLKKLRPNGTLQETNPFMAFMWQYSASILITVMYALFPTVFSKLAVLEKYYPATEQNVTIARIVLLRLAPVILLLTPIYNRVMSCQSDQLCGECDRIFCWETFIGQQLYKLVLLDFFVSVAVVFLIEFPRKALWKRFKHKKLFEYIGQEEFNIPVNVMDVVYTQTLCWLGTFYSPLLPVITFVKVVLFFYLRKLSLFHNQKPALSPYRAASMNLFFKIVLSVSFFCSILAVGVSIGVIPPSKACGPFRSHSNIETPYTMFGAVSEAMLLIPSTLRDIIKFLSSPAFIVALIVALILAIYVYSAIGIGQIRLAELLQDTLKSESKDKQWLLGKVNRSLRRHLSVKAKETPS